MHTVQIQTGRCFVVVINSVKVGDSEREDKGKERKKRTKKEIGRQQTKEEVKKRGEIERERVRRRSDEFR